MNKKLTFSNDGVQRAVRNIGVLRVALWFLLITIPISLLISAAFQFLPEIYMRVTVALCGFSAALGLFIWKFIRMSREDA